MALVDPNFPLIITVDFGLFKAYFFAIVTPTLKHTKELKKVKSKERPKIIAFLHFYSIRI